MINLNAKKVLMCLLIVGMLMSCVPNVAVAQTSKLATETHNTYKYTINQPSGAQPPQHPTHIALAILDKYGNPSSSIQAAPAQDYTIVGVLYWGDSSTPTPSNTMGGARIYFYQSSDGNNWHPIWTVTVTTESGGQFNGFFKLHESGLFKGITNYYKATFNGDIGYDPCESNVVSATIV